MKSLTPALCLALLASTTWADNPLPPPPEGGLMTISQSECVDIETRVEGFCVLSRDRLGNIYMVFLIDGEIWQIRQIVDDGYTVIWTATPGELL